MPEDKKVDLQVPEAYRPISITKTLSNLFG